MSSQPRDYCNASRLRLGPGSDPLSAAGQSSLDDVLVMLDAAGRVATWNLGAEEMFGYRSAEIVGQHVARFFEPADVGRDRPAHLLELALLDRIEERVRQLRKDGSSFWAHLVFTMQQDERGDLRGFILRVRDSTAASHEPDPGDSEAQLHAILKNGSSAMFIKDTAGRYVHINDEFARQFAVAQAGAEGRSDAEIFPSALAHALQANDALVLRQGATMEFEQQCMRPDGSHTNVIRKFPVVDAAGRVVGVGGTITDVTSRLLAAQAAERQSGRQSLIVAFGQFALQNPELEELIAEAMATIAKGIHPEYCRYLALTTDETLLQLKAGSGWQGIWADQVNFDAVVETQDRFSIGARETLLIEDYATESRFRPSPVIRDHAVRSGAEVLVWGSNGPYGLLGIYSREARAFSRESVDFLQGIKNTLAAALDRKCAEDRLAYLAQFDALTGLPNRNLFLDRLWQTLRQTDREKRAVGVVFVDVDRFKSVNDKIGHGGGDEVLTLVASRLKECVRPADTVARLSGDEFAIVLDYLARPEDASVVAERIITSLIQPFRVRDQDIYVSASLGISISPTDGSNPDSLLKNADLAMHRAKQAGRSTYRFFLPDMNARAAARLQTETELRGALERREFVLHYQPKVDLKTGRISGFEALLRWNHPKRGLVMPGEFIPVLEDTGLINDVGDWVVRQACAQIRQWRSEGLQSCAVAVNLSARQFTRNSLDFSIGKILDASQIDPQLLEFELTESVLMSDSEDAVQVLDNLKKYGVRLSVDDFGTGYSSLAYLKRFPLDALKIDRTFIRHITTDQGDATIATAIINLAHSLNLKVVAEGVETQSQLDFLRRHACDEMQGYLFARPMPAADCARAMREDRRLPGTMHPQD